MTKQTEDLVKRGKSLDWEAIERDFRAGMLSIREIAKLHDISDTAIRKKAKSGEWDRDLSAKVDERVRTKLVRNAVRTNQPQTEEEIIEEAATVKVTIVREHHRLISNGIKITELLSEQLIRDAESREDLEQDIEDMTADDKDTRRRNRLMKAVSLGTHSTIAVNLANATKTWIGLERQAFNIADEPAEIPQTPGTATDDDLDAAIAQFAAKAGISLTAG